MKGIVKWYNVKKGYGFIKGEDDQEYFVHYTALPRDTRFNENDKVSFETSQNERGLHAVNVQKLEGGAASVEEAPSEEKPMEESPVEEKPMEEASSEEKPMEESPVEEKPMEEAPSEEE